MGQLSAEIQYPTPNTLVMHTELVRNVQQSLDHNSQLYSRIWLNALVPFLAGSAQMALDPKSTAQERINYGLSMLELRSPKPLKLTTEALIDQEKGQVPLCSFRVSDAQNCAKDL